MQPLLGLRYRQDLLVLEAQRAAERDSERTVRRSHVSAEVDVGNEFVRRRRAATRLVNHSRTRRDRRTSPVDRAERNVDTIVSGVLSNRNGTGSTTRRVGT